MFSKNLGCFSHREVNISTTCSERHKEAPGSTENPEPVSALLHSSPDGGAGLQAQEAGEEGRVAVFSHLRAQSSASGREHPSVQRLGDIKKTNSLKLLSFDI